MARSRRTEAARPLPSCRSRRHHSLSAARLRAAPAPAQPIARPRGRRRRLLWLPPNGGRARSRIPAPASWRFDGAVRRSRTAHAFSPAIWGRLRRRPHRLARAAGEQRWEPVTLPLPRDIELQEIEDDRVASPPPARELAARLFAGTTSPPAHLPPGPWICQPGGLRRRGRMARALPGRRRREPARRRWIEEAWPRRRAAPAFHLLVQWLAGHGIPVPAARRGLPFGDSPVLPDLDRLATEI